MGADASLPCGPAVHLPFCKLCPPFSSPSNRDPHMELREEAWSPGPLDSEDQQMASHENPGEVGLGSCQRTPSPSPDPGSLRLPSGGSEIPSFPPEALASAPARLSPGLGGVKFPSSCTSLGATGGQLLAVSCQGCPLLPVPHGVVPVPPVSWALGPISSWSLDSPRRETL